MKKIALISTLALTLSVPAVAQQAVNPYLANVPLSAGPITLPISPGGRGMRPYEMSKMVSPEEKSRVEYRNFNHTRPSITPWNSP
jgi:hypothetical protein